MLQFMLHGSMALQQFPGNTQAVITPGQRFPSCNICGSQNAPLIRVTQAINGINFIMAQMLLYYRDGCRLAFVRVGLPQYKRKEH